VLTEAKCGSHQYPEVGINDSNKYRIGGGVVREQEQVVDVRKGEIVYKQGIQDGLNVRE